METIQNIHARYLVKKLDYDEVTKNLKERSQFVSRDQIRIWNKRKTKLAQEVNTLKASIASHPHSNQVSI